MGTFTALWACKRAMVSFHGAYPENFLERVYSMLGVSQGWKVCHLFSGTLKSSANEVCVDIKYGQDARFTGFPDGTFDLVLADPPYDVKNSKVYGVTYPRIGEILKEELRLTKQGGYFGLLHFIVPINPDKKKARRVAVIGVTQGANMRIRCFTLFKKVFEKEEQ